MTPGPLDSALQIASMLCEALIVLAMVRSPLAQKWLPLIAFESFQIANSLVLRQLSDNGSGNAYLCAYWAGCVVSYALELWLLATLATRLFAWLAPRRRSIMWIAFAVTVALASAVAVEVLAPSTYSTFAMNALISIERTVMMGWCVATIALVGVSGMSGIKLKQFEGQMLCAFAAPAAAGLLWAIMAERLPSCPPAIAGTLFNLLYLFSGLFLLIAVVVAGRQQATRAPDVVTVLAKDWM